MTSDPLEIPTPDLGAAALSADRRSALTPGSLGDLAAWVDTLAALRRAPDLPVAPSSAHLVVFAGDHGLAARNCTADLPAATAHRAAALADGTATTSRVAAQTGVTVHVIDVAIDADSDLGSDLSSEAGDGAGVGGPVTGVSGVEDARIRRGSGAIDVEDALTLDELARAIQLGRDRADQLIDAGADQLIGAVCGVGAGTAATAIASYLTGVEPVDATGRGTGVDDAAWIRRVALVRDARFRLTVGSGDAATLLRVAGGADLAALTGLVLQSALRGVPVLLDDLPGTVAAVLAHRFAPGAERYVMVPATLPLVLHRRLLGLLNVTPLTPIQLGTGTALPSLLLLPLLRLAAGVVDDAPQQTQDRAPWAVDDWDRALL